MPKGIPNKQTEVIDITATVQRVGNGARGRMAFLAQDYLMKHRVLVMAGEILDADAKQLAADHAPRKFLEALNHRAKTALPPEPEEATVAAKAADRKPRHERLHDIRVYLKKHPGADTREVGEAVGIGPAQALKLLHHVAKMTKQKNKQPSTWVLRKGQDKKIAKAPKAAKAVKAKPVKAAKTNGKRATTGWFAKPKINGSALTLFLLDHLHEERPTTFAQMGEKLAEAGSPLKSLRILNAPLGGSFKKQGLAVKRGDGYVATPKATAMRSTLREALVANGTVAAGGGYAAPA